VIVFLTTADTEILAVARAAEFFPEGFPEVRCLNPASPPWAGDPEALLEQTDGAGAVLLRLLGGVRAWPAAADLRRRCAEHGVPLLAFGGESEPDAELAALSTAPAGTVAEAFEYLRHGGVGNVAALLRFVADTVLFTGFGFDPASPLPEAGVWMPPSLEEALAPVEAGEAAEAAEPAGQGPPHGRPPHGARPRVGIVFYRAHWMSGNTGFVETLAHAVAEAGGVPVPVWCYSLRPDAEGRVAAADLLREVDALIVTVLASGGSSAGDAFRGAGGDRPASWSEWHAQALDELDVPVLQGICATTTREAWEASDAGLTPMDAAMQVAIPEFDGRIVGVPFSFKEPLSDEPGSPLVYRADPERAARLARLAVAQGRLGRIPNGDKRVALLLSNYPTKHARVGNAVGLDTPASALRLLAALAADGYDVGVVPDDGDALIHALIAAGGWDSEFLTEEQARTSPRVDGGRYADWFAAVAAPLREGIRTHWGEPPGELYTDGGDLVLAGLRFGNVFVGIQPPRGFGENPVAIYHDPDLPPSHHYLAAYRWLEEEFGAHAIVHLGKHGTLEWLPGKGLGLSAACAPDAVLGAVPLFYPFVVNDPGEGTQAKRRAHAVVIDHLVPPMMRADTYDELARLEQLLDEYAEVSALDPAKIPAIQGRIWELVREAELHRDLGLDERPEDFDDFVLHVDGYLCEIKDLRIKDGLHVLGEAPRGEQRLGLVAAILRVAAGKGQGLRRAVAAAVGLDEAALLASPGTRVEAPAELIGRFPGPAATGSDLVDRLEDAQRALLEGLASAGWQTSAAAPVCAAVLGFEDPGVVDALVFTTTEVVPRIEQTPDEIDNLLHGLSGGFVPSGPSGSPTRGLVNVLPTGRNFYSVDPKALPSELAWETGQRLADDVIRRYRGDEGTYPETVGIVVWGTSAMRTHGDDIAEILALLGVRPVWDGPSRRVTGLEVVPLDELERPRIDVTVRISGFFRDAFPNLIALVDEAVRTVAVLDEDDARNYVARHARAARAAGAGERRATTRIFGSKPGAYGAGLLPLIDARNWRTDADLARVYEVWGGYAYGHGLDGVEDPEAMRENFSRIQVALKNVDNREHDLLDSDDYFQYHGGMVASVRALTGAAPRAYIADSSDPGAVATRALAEETRRVFRARVVNPKWIASMARHGYKGAFELSATVDYLFGYDATTGVVDDWMYEAVAQRYVFDEETAAFMRASNPWAMRAIAERLLEAADRQLWAEPQPGTLARLRAAYLELEGELEETQSQAPVASGSRPAHDGGRA
jgi:cobaltochelatase CobN